MKAIMYHYVREDVPELPHFNHLHVEDFRKQLDFFETEFGFVRKEDFLAGLASGTSPQGVVLTFDDGLADHYEYVFPELASRGLWGVFYVTCGVYRDIDLLDVHRTHILLGAHGGIRVLDALSKHVDESMLVNKHRKAFQEETYREHDDAEATKEAKRILNYFSSPQERSKVLGTLVAELGMPEAARPESYYMTPEQLRQMHHGGMIIGSHAMTHSVMSTLSADTQSQEIHESFSILEHAIGGMDVKTYCHPYGRAHSYNADTIRLLNEARCHFSFDVNSRDIESHDLLEGVQTLPRYNCNEFPHGSIRRTD